MAGVSAAVDRLQRAIRCGEGIGLHGDYDVDGVSATAVLAETLERLGARPIVRIPHRVRDGYGLSAAAVRSLGEAAARVIVTVDCGITANAEVALATDLGIDVVVTDHHHVPTFLPAAYAVLNPRQPGCEYGFRELSGVGVAYVLARALLEGGLPPTAAEASAEALLDLVALGTIADLVPLVGENRVLVARGLRVLQGLRRPGIAALMAVAGARPEGLSAQRVAFTLAPRLNAAGRMGDATSAYALLTAVDATAAEALAAELNTANRERQQAVGAGEARARKAADPAGPAIVVAGEYPLGIAGLIAGRLAEETGRPAVVLERGTEYCKGSARAPGGFHLAEALAACSDLLVKYGGHAQAARPDAGNVQPAGFRGALSGARGRGAGTHRVRSTVGDRRPGQPARVQLGCPAGAAGTGALWDGQPSPTLSHAAGRGARRAAAGRDGLRPPIARRRPDDARQRLPAGRSTAAERHHRERGVRGGVPREWGAGVGRAGSA